MNTGGGPLNGNAARVPPSTSNPSLSDRPIEKEEKNDGWLRSIRGDCALIEIDKQKRTIESHRAEKHPLELTRNLKTVDHDKQKHRKPPKTMGVPSCYGISSQKRDCLCAYLFPKKNK